MLNLLSNNVNVSKVFLQIYSYDFSEFISQYEQVKVVQNILRKTIARYLGSVPSLTFNTIKTKLIMPAFYSSRYLQSKWMLNFSHALMVEVPYTSKWCNPLY